MGNDRERNLQKKMVSGHALGVQRHSEALHPPTSGLASLVTSLVHSSRSDSTRIANVNCCCRLLSRSQILSQQPGEGRIMCLV